MFPVRGVHVSSWASSFYTWEEDREKGWRWRLQSRWGFPGGLNVESQEEVTLCFTNGGECAFL